MLPWRLACDFEGVLILKREEEEKGLFVNEPGGRAVLQGP
jgi:hypothetical protein